MEKNDILDFVYDMIDKNKDKMIPSDYLYLLMKEKEIQDKINTIKDRDYVHTRQGTK